MRRILFRGKRLDTGEWAEGFFAQFYDSESHTSARIYPGWAKTDCGEFYPEFFEVDPETVGQYIGFEDANDTRIYEGDIVRYHKPLTPWGHNLADGTEGMVDFSGGAFYMAVRRTAAVTDLYLLNSFFGAHGSIIEVIGNIYDKEDDENE